MNTVPFVVALAVIWHAGLALAGRSRRPSEPSLERLLCSAELELLETLRAELVALTRSKPKISGRYGRKLHEIQDWIRRLRGDKSEG